MRNSRVLIDGVEDRETKFMTKDEAKSRGREAAEAFPAADVTVEVYSGAAEMGVLRFDRVIDDWVEQAKSSIGS